MARKKHDPDCQPSQKKLNREEENEEGMDIFWKYLLKIDQTYPSKQGMIDLVLNLSTKTSNTKGWRSKNKAAQRTKLFSAFEIQPGHY